MYAIYNKRTKKFLYGTDYRYSPPRQRTSFDDALLFESDFKVKQALKHRRCGKDYVAVRVSISISEEVIA